MEKEFEDIKKCSDCFNLIGDAVDSAMKLYPQWGVQKALEYYASILDQHDFEE